MVHLFGTYLAGRRGCTRRPAFPLERNCVIHFLRQRWSRRWWDNRVLLQFVFPGDDDEFRPRNAAVLLRLELGDAELDRRQSKVLAGTEIARYSIAQFLNRDLAAEASGHE